MEGEAFDEADVEFAAVERLTGDGVERAGGDHTALDQGDGGVIDFFAEIEADVEVRVRIALVRVFDERADGGDEGALDPIFGEDVAFGGGETAEVLFGEWALQPRAWAGWAGSERMSEPLGKTNESGFVPSVVVGWRRRRAKSRQRWVRSRDWRRVGEMTTICCWGSEMAWCRARRAVSVVLPHWRWQLRST